MTRKSKKKSAIILAAINLNSQRSAFALLGASYSQCGQSSFPLGILLPSPSLPREHHCYPHPGAWLSHLHFRKSGLEVGLKKHDHILFGAKKWPCPSVETAGAKHVTFFFLPSASEAEKCYSFWPMTRKKIIKKGGKKAHWTPHFECQPMEQE